MELKYYILLILVAGMVSSNRTFMELKFQQNEMSSLQGGVLIVPLWN